jgi:hypothetical protein
MRGISTARLPAISEHLVALRHFVTHRLLISGVSAPILSVGRKSPLPFPSYGAASQRHLPEPWPPRSNPGWFFLEVVGEFYSAASAKDAPKA